MTLLFIYKTVVIKLTNSSKMKFKSRKDKFFQILTFGFCLLVIVHLVFRLFVENELEFIWSDILLVFIGGLLLWLNFGTEYILTPSELKYSSGPLRGKIKLENIHEVIEGKTMWSGIKPATAKYGLIIKYGKYDQIYISPDSNDKFIKKITELNNNIKITTTSKAMCRKPDDNNVYKK